MKFKIYNKFASVSYYWLNALTRHEPAKFEKNSAFHRKNYFCVSSPCPKPKMKMLQNLSFTGTLLLAICIHSRIQNWKIICFLKKQWSIGLLEKQTRLTCSISVTLSSNKSLSFSCKMLGFYNFFWMRYRVVSFRMLLFYFLTSLWLSEN